MTESNWQTLLDRDPADAALRLQYSDWLEEQGRTGAEVQRWLARARKWPNKTPIDWEWWREGWGMTHRHLPAILFRHLPGPSRDYQTYSTRQAAEQALVARLGAEPGD